MVRKAWQARNKLNLLPSNLVTWRRQREQGLLKMMSPKKLGRKQKANDPSAKRIARLEEYEEYLEDNSGG